MLKQNENEKKRDKNNSNFQSFSIYEWKCMQTKEIAPFREVSSLALLPFFFPVWHFDQAERSALLARLNWLFGKRCTPWFGRPCFKKVLGHFSKCRTKGGKKYWRKKPACEGRTFTAPLEIVQVSTTLFSHSFFLSGVLKNPKKYLRAGRFIFTAQPIIHDLGNECLS